MACRQRQQGLACGQEQTFGMSSETLFFGMSTCRIPITYTYDHMCKADLYIYILHPLCIYIYKYIIMYI